MKKFELTTDTKLVYGKTLYRIRALVSFGDIKAGDMGGWIEKESNLSQVYGDAWVYGNARVYGNAQVSGDAQVYGSTWVYGNAWVSDDAQVSGDAQVYGNAWVYGNVEKTPIHISGLYWPVTITDAHIKIGCEFHKTTAWEAFGPLDIRKMHTKAVDFWHTHKTTILTLARTHQT